MLKLRIEIDPLPCPRPRVATRGKFAHAYYPASYGKWKELFAEKEEGIAEPLDGPLVVRIDNYVRKPRTSKLTHPSGDVDNYAKSVLDALTQIGIWRDDKQVVSLIVTKQFTNGTPLVCVEITSA